MGSHGIRRKIQNDVIVHHGGGRPPRHGNKIQNTAATLQKPAGMHSGAVRFPARMEQRGHDHSHIIQRNQRGHLPPREQ